MLQSLKFYRFHPTLNKSVLIGRLRSGLFYLTANVLKHLIEFSNIHAIAIPNEILNSQFCFTSSLNKDMSLGNHPLGIRFEAAGRANHLAKEVDLPERFDMEFKKLIPSAGSSFGTRFNPFFMEDVLDSRPRNRVNSQFFQFTENPTVSPTRFTRQTDNDVSPEPEF